MKQKWTTRQNQIYEGLRLIGQEIAGFYEGGLRFYYEDFPNSAYFLLHAAREIDGGIRDILSVDYNPEKDEKEKHKKSILHSLGPEFTSLSDSWYSISKKLHKYAHRRGAWRTPRNLNDVKKFWDEFELILERLIGSYFSIIERIEKLSSLKNISKNGVIDTLSNIFTTPAYYNYFFYKEKDIKWFTQLNKKNYFSPQQINFDEKGNAQSWNVLDYLERVSQQLNEHPEHGKDLIKILEDIVQFSQNTRKINNLHIWWYCSKILTNIPIDQIQKEIPIDQFHDWLHVFVSHSIDNSLSVEIISDKLLPNFFTDNSNIKYAEAIIDVLTEIEPSGKSHSSTQKEEVLLTCDHYFVMEAFKKYFQEIGERCSLNLIYTIAVKLKKALEYEHKSTQHIIEIKDNTYQIEVSRVQKENSKGNQFDFEKDQYICKVGQYTHDQLEGITDENKFVKLFENEPKENIIEFTFKAKNNQELISALNKNLPADIDWHSSEEYKSGINFIYRNLNSDFLYIWFKFLKDARPERNTDTADRALTVIFRDLLSVKCISNPAEGKEILESIISNEYKFPIYIKLALLCIDTYWPTFKDLFDTLFKSFDDLFENVSWEVELHSILKNHNNDFSPLLIEVIKNRINSIPDYYTEKGEEAEAYWQYKCLSPLEKHPEFSSWYEQTKVKSKIIQDKPYEPDRSDTEARWLSYKSPLTKEEILQMPVFEVVKFLNEFKGAERQEGLFEEKPTKEGLRDEFQAAIKENPQKFTDELKAFIKVDPFYISRMIEGFKEAWYDKKETVLTWEKLFEFIELILNDQKKEKDTNDEDEHYTLDQIIRSISDLIESGSKSDDHAFDPKHFNNVDKIYDLMTSLLKPEEEDPEIKHDAVSYALNSTTGYVIRTFVIFSLRKTRATKTKEENWGENKYERFFKIGIEAFIWFGNYLPQISYLDEEYSKEKVDEFNDLPVSDNEWQNFMQGYLSSHTIYEEIYDLMRINYKKAIKNNQFNESVNQSLVQHISLGYLSEYEMLQEKNDDGKESLFWKLLFDSDTSVRGKRWLEVADFLWTNTDRVLNYKKETSNSEKSIQRNEKIIKFWKWTFDIQEKVKQNIPDEYNAFLSKIALFTITLKKIDKAKANWINLSVPYIETFHNVSLFIEYLTKFKDEESLKHIGTILNKMLEHTTPYSGQDDIKLIVERLYANDQKENADSICNTFGRRGYDFLKETWKENNP